MQYTFIFSYICIHNYVFKNCPKNKWYHKYVKYICFHIYVTSFFKIIYKENIKLNIKKLKKSI